MTLSPAFLDGIGFSEMLVIGFIAILVFGGKLPDALRNVGRSYAKFRKSIQDVSRPLREEIQRATTLPPETFTPALPRPRATTPPVPGGSASTPSPSPLPAPYALGGAPRATDPSGDLTAASAPPAAATAAPRAADFDDEPPPV